MLLAISWNLFTTAYSFIAVVLSAFYCYIIRKYIKGWDDLPEWHIPPGFSPTTKVSILIPARNEETQIGACLDSIAKLNYPKSKFEVIVIDDHSEDETATIVRTYGEVKLIQLADHVQDQNLNSYKKKAIEIAINEASGDLIVTTDADCIVPVDWLNYLVSMYESTSAKFIAAPVNFHQENSLIERFQSLDFVGMMCVTGSGIQGKFMNTCNGANLAYEKKTFLEVGGFEDIQHIASGDDILLMHKISAAFPDKIKFLKNKNAVVLTAPKPTFQAFFNQRLRWATKNSKYKDWKIIFILAMVLFLCMSIGISFILSPFLSCSMLLIFAFQLFFKTLADYFFLHKMSNYFNRPDLMKSFIPAQVIHIFYILIVGIAGNFVSKYEWKGRKVK